MRSKQMGISLHHRSSSAIYHYSNNSENISEFQFLFKHHTHCLLTVPIRANIVLQITVHSCDGFKYVAYFLNPDLFVFPKLKFVLISFCK